MWERHTKRGRNRLRGVSFGAIATGVMCAVVVAAMVAVAIASRSTADRHRRAQVLVERLRATSQEISALKWRVNAQILTGSVDLSMDGPVVIEGARLLTQLGDEVSAFERLQPGADARRLSTDVSELFAHSFASVTAVGSPSSRSPAALARTQRDFQPVLDRMDADSQRVATKQAAVAHDALERLTWLTVGAILVGLAVLTLLGWRLSRLRRRNALAEEVREIERRSERRIRALVEQSSDVVTVVDGDLCVRWQAASARSLLGVEPSTVLQCPISSIVHPEDRELFDSFLHARLDGGGPASHRLRLEHASGRWVHVEAIAEDRTKDPTIGGLVLHMRDISERLAFEDELRRQAFHDALTGLANRALFEDRLRHALAAGLRTLRPLAVLFLDLDDFKTINDSLGHAAGDELLQCAAGRIDPLVRPTDTAARLGGDEFAILLDGVESAGEAQEVANRILDALADSFWIGDRELNVTASIGIAMSDGSVDADELLRNADMAMYAAKASGKNVAHPFEQTMHRSVIERLELRNELPRALANDELFLDYQPIVSLQSGRIAGVEALVRWQHPARGLLVPDQFIAIAEETGIIVPLGRWVLEEACSQVRQWHLTCPAGRALYVSVNVSTRQLHEERFVDSVSEVLSHTGIDPAAVVLEITEGLLADDRRVVVRRLKALKRLGVRIAVDDFGTGYSALSHLQQFPIDILKIDKSFIDELHTSSQKANLVQGIINLGKSLRLDVIAEGIEQPQQAQRLRAMRSQLGQGFLFSRPESADRILALLRESWDARQCADGPGVDAP